MLNQQDELLKFNSYIYQLAGITIQISTSRPVSKQIFDHRFQKFEVNAPGSDIITINHHFYLPDIRNWVFGNNIYRKFPWAIYRQDSNWIYLGISPDTPNTIFKLAKFKHDHSLGEIFTPEQFMIDPVGWDSVILFPTDQILLARLLADRQGCIFHSAGMIIDGQGFLFVGHSGAGKSTMVTMLQNEGEILCDDRIIVRRWPEGFKIHGTWSHGDVPIVSPNSAPLRAIFLLEQAAHNRLIPITDRKEIVRRLPFFIVKPLVTADWWEKTLDLVGAMAREAPVYRLQFDKSGGVIEILKELL